jgi:hypothetical protein
MILTSSARAAAARRSPIEGHGQTYFVSGYVGVTPVRGTYVEGNEKNDDGMPQGFLVEQPPGSVTPPHFHEVNQFQVFVGGDGRIGKHDAAPVSVHYASGHTPYGPIAAGAAGVDYFTLRAGFDPGAKYMPAQRAKLRPGPRRSRMAANIPATDAVTLAGRGSPVLDVILEPETDGLQAHLLRLGANGTAVLPDPAGGGGQYLVVINGTLSRDGDALDRLSCLFVSRDEQPLSATAGPDGLELLILQFPDDRSN